MCTMNRQRPTRVRAAPARLHEEQASQHEVAALLAQFRNPVTPAVVSSNSDEESDTDSGPEEGEERKQGDRRPSARPWRKEHTPIRPLAFCPPRRPAHRFDRCETPLDFFRLLITDEFIDACVSYTNTFAQQRIDAAPEPAAAASHSAPWTETTAEEIKALLGCLIYMGIVCMNDTRDYWAQATAQPFIHHLHLHA